MFCECGCGEITKRHGSRDRRAGYEAGQHHRFVYGHQSRAQTLAQLKNYVVADDGCWLWTGRLNGNGYGMVGNRLAHRLLYERLREAIPAGMQIDHLCRVHRCVNPDHLEVVTPAENSRRGDKTKLTLDQVEAILRSDEPHSVLAERYGVSAVCVYFIRSGQTWRGATSVQPTKRAPLASRGKKLTADQARAIRGSAEPQRVLAERYGVSGGVISEIRAGKLWRAL